MKSTITFFRACALAALLLLIPGIKRACGQTVGDIAFTGYNSQPSGTCVFSFVVLRLGGLSASMPITFTDKGWDPTANGGLGGFYAASEGYFTWTPSGSIAVFTEVTISVTGNVATASTGSCSATSGGTFALSASLGDQLLAFSGTLTSPSFITGIHANNISSVGGSGQPVSSASGWDPIAAASGPSGWTISADKSAIPPSLANGTNAVMLVDNPGAGGGAALHNFKFDCGAGGINATAASLNDLRSKLNNAANWIKQNTTAVSLPSGCTFGLAVAPAITSQPSNASVCAGNSASFTASASNPTGWTWEISTNGGGSYSTLAITGVYSVSSTTGSTGSSTLTISNATGLNGNMYRAVATGTSNATSNSATLTVSTPGTWLGTASTAWSNTANWSCGTLPTSSTNVTIPSGTTNSPVIDITSAVANNLTINSGATLSFTGTTNAISINGTLTPTGTFTTAGGKVTFAGSTQTIPAITYQNLQMNGAGSKTLAGPTTVNGVLTLTTGHLILGNNNLTIGSSGSISGGTTINSFVVTNGTGGLVQQNIGAGGRTGTILFPVGIATTSFTPVRINNASGTADHFTGRVINHVYTAYNASDMPTGTQISSKVVDRTWFLTEDVAGGSNATVTVQWNGSAGPTNDELSGFDNANCVLSHYLGGAWTNHGMPFSAANGFDPYTLSVSGVTSFSPFGVGSPGSPLPVNLISFEGTCTAGNVQLIWKAAQENGMQQYEVERSASADRFERTGKPVAALNSNSAHSYSFTDAAAPVNATLYYRLRMVNQNGTSSYSNVVKINTGKNTGYNVTLVNNPAKEQVEFRITSIHPETAAVVISDLAGRILSRSSYTLISGEQLISMPLSKLTGNTVYLVKVQLGNQTHAFKILVN